MKRLTLCILLFLFNIPDARANSPGFPVEGAPGIGATLARVIMLLDAHPQTKWEDVNLAALRQVLMDLDLVFSQAEVERQDRGNALVYSVTGRGAVVSAIRRVAHNHRRVMATEWHYEVLDMDQGAWIRIVAPEKHRVRLRAIGVMGLWAMAQEPERLFRLATKSDF